MWNDRNVRNGRNVRSWKDSCVCFLSLFLASYTNWNGGEPNDAGGEDCTEMYDNGMWNDIPCDRADVVKAYVCEKSAGAGKAVTSVAPSKINSCFSAAKT